MYISIDKKELLLGRKMRIIQEIDDIQRQYNAAKSLADKALYEDKDEDKAMYYLAKTLELIIKSFEYVKELERLSQIV